MRPYFFQSIVNSFLNFHVLFLFMFMFMFRLESCPMPVAFESSGPIREMFESFAPQVTVNCLDARARKLSDSYYASETKGLSC